MRHTFSAPVQIGVRYRLSNHAREEIERRKIPLPFLEATLEKPGQIVSEQGTLSAYQSKCDIVVRCFC